MDSEGDAAAEYARLRESRIAYFRSLDEGEIDRRLMGEHVSTLEEIWTIGHVDGINGSHQLIDPAWYGEIVRSPEQGLALYPEIVSDVNLNMPPAASRSSSTTNTAQDKGKKLDMFLNADPEAAHLIGCAALSHKAYGFLAEAATGKILAPEDKQGRFKLLNGVFQDESNSRRVSGTGLKHHKYNKMLLTSQKGLLSSRS
jgi:hypothetical protein